MIKHTAGPWELSTDSDGDITIRTTYEFERTERNHIHGGTFKAKSRITIAAIRAATTKAYYPASGEKLGNAKILASALPALDNIRAIVKAYENGDHDKIKAEIANAKRILKNLD